LKGFLRWLGREVYGAVLPAPEGAGAEGAERYLEDLWRDAPRFVAFGQTMLALAVCLLPPILVKRFCLFPSLPCEEQERMLRRMISSRWYLLRWAGQACRQIGLIAVLRDPAGRKAMLNR
jgi:hypothetical protein